MNTNRRTFIKAASLAGAGLMTSGNRLFGQPANSDGIRVGIIGLDTSHSPAFAKAMNNAENPLMEGIKVVAAYPYGSKTIESSYKRIPGYTDEFKKMGIAIVDSEKELLQQVDAVLLETNDGNLHLEQALQVLEAGKPVFIDKPVAAGIKDTYKIFAEAEKRKVKMFSSSSLRYMEKAQQVRYEGLVGDLTGADAFSPINFEPSHSPLYWYGIHGVEILYTMLGQGCQWVKWEEYGDHLVASGQWKDGKLGIFRGDLKGRQQYGGTAYGTKGATPVGPYGGYGALVDVIAKFFKSGEVPIAPAETLELYSFMEAAAWSRDRKGEKVMIKEVIDSI